jgi:hypothetical protein
MIILPKTLKIMVATTLVGLWVIPTSALSSVTQFAGRTTVAGGFQVGAGFTAVQEGNAQILIQTTGANRFFDYVHNGQNVVGYRDNSSNWPKWAQNGSMTIQGNTIVHNSWGVAVAFAPPPSRTLTIKISVDGVETTVSQTSYTNNAPVTINQPSAGPNTTFLSWTLNGTSQSSSLPYNFTITQDTTAVFFYNENPTYAHNITLDADSYQPRAVTIVGSVQGAIAVGYILEPGETFSGSYFVSPGETITVTVDGVVVSTHTFPVENPIDYTDNISLEGVPQPTPTPTPTPSPSPTPSTIFNGTNNVPPPSSTPPPINGGGGSGNTGGSGGTSTPNLTNPPPPPSLNNNTLPNPFGTFNPSNPPTQTSQDLYGVIKKAIQDATGENGPQEQELSDTEGLQTSLDNNVSDLTNNLSSTVTKVYELTDQFSELAENGSDLANAFIPQFPNVGIDPSIPIEIPTIGSFNLNINNLPGIGLFRALTTFFLWLMGIIFAIHIIRKAIA